jgi:radical S-adenosyl methionine domain-containing protein 2
MLVKSKEMFETVSFHIVKPCNMKCKFCYATFEDFHVGPQLSLENAFKIINDLFKAGVEKVTFAGGEPLLYKHIKEVIVYTKQLGITTSIITNGSLLTESFLAEMRPYLDWIGVSIDSIYNVTNQQIGRTEKSNWQSRHNYYNLVSQIKDYGYKLKINTVVNAFNQDEDLNDFIAFARPERWKVFQTLKVEGQNDKQFNEIKCTSDQFTDFITRHSAHKCLVPEDNEAMTGSYLLIDPLGRLFENSKGKHTYSDSLVNNDLETCLSQISLDREMFIKRGGIYNW